MARHRHTAKAAQRPAEVAPVVDREEVALLAYQLYLQRGQTNGRELDDWLKAEAILKRRRNGAA